MTIEVKYSIGLEDIEFVQLECKKCHTRVSMTPANWDFQYACPNLECKAPWWTRHTASEVDSRARTALNAIAQAKDLIGERDFTVSFEVRRGEGK
jgi:hypothetical protein